MAVTILVNETPSEEISQLYETPGPIVPLTTFSCGGTSPEQIVNAVGVIVPPTTCGRTVNCNCITIFRTTC